MVIESESEKLIAQEDIFIFRKDSLVGIVGVAFRSS